MNCIRCKNEKMQKVYASIDESTKELIAFSGENTKFGMMKDKQSVIDAYVCINCGYVELKARNPEVFIKREEEKCLEGNIKALDKKTGE